MAYKSHAGVVNDGLLEKSSRISISVPAGDSPFSHVTLKHRRTTLERVEKFLSDKYFADVNLFSRFETLQNVKFAMTNSMLEVILGLDEPCMMR